MDTIRIEKKNTLMVAHRGLSGIETENTNSAFVAAGNRTYFGIETDIHRTSDGKFVINHDEHLKRVADVDFNVEENPLSESQKIVLKDIDGTKERLDLIPTYLENYLAICKKYEKHCVLELKSDFTDEEIKSIIDIINSYGVMRDLTFISFNYENLVKVRKFLPTQSAQFLFSEFTDEIIENLKRDRIDVDVAYPALTEDIIKELHKEKLKVNCWTVNDPELAKKFIGWGVDYITTNILE